MAQGRIVLAGGLLLCCLQIVACSSVEKLFTSEQEDVEYKTAKALPPLEVPPDLTGGAGTPLEIPGEEPAPDNTTYSEYQAQRAQPAQHAQSEQGGDAIRKLPETVTYQEALESREEPKSPQPVLEKTDQGAARIRIPEAFPRSWRDVGQALGAAEIEIEDRDRSQGIYFIRYHDPDASSGSWVSALKFWGDDKPDLGSFLVVVQEENSETSQVMIFDQQKQLLVSPVALEILNAIYRKMK